MSNRIFAATRKGLFTVSRSVGLPLVAALFPIPKIALLPLLILWLGIGEGSKVATIALSVFFPTVIATFSGVDSVPRNLIRMARGRKIFDHFLVPGPDQPLGHFLEYAKEQLEWHLEKAGFQVVESSLQQLTWGGATRGARLARKLLRPVLGLRPLWRDHIVLMGRRPL